jgi:thiosulfate dehydrogenase [quinone] large subunit
MKKVNITMLLLRLSMGFIFLWAFLDKTFGLGFATSTEKAWMNGGSPTFGFLTNAVKGPFAEFFQSLAGSMIVDWMFMLGLLFVGVTLIFNKYVKWGCIAGGIMLMLMYFALLFPENNPIIDDHIVYTLVLALIAFRNRVEV